MALTRRSLLFAGTGIAALPLLGEFAPRASARYVAARRGTDGATSVALLAEDGRELGSVPIPSRGHDFAISPDNTVVAAFARRPGVFAVIMHAASGEVMHTIAASPNRCFNGHGSYSSDGKLLYATENDAITGDGYLGIYATDAGYRRIGEFASEGVGPHDICFAPAFGGFVVANGGLKGTDGKDREFANGDTFTSSLALIDVEGRLSAAPIGLGAEFSKLSIRHLTQSATGTLVFACQSIAAADDMGPLVGRLLPSGKVAMLEAPDADLMALKGYVGDVSLDRSGEIVAATSPRGNVVLFWRISDGKYLGKKPLSDVCGVSYTQRSGEFFLTSGQAGLNVGTLKTLKPLADDPRHWTWDNHVHAFT